MDQGLHSSSTKSAVSDEEPRPPYLHAMIAGGIGGTTGDMLMHSLDTVKTRQQGDLRRPPRYTSLASTYATIFRQEGVRRGLYGGWTPAMLGSLPGTVIFFATYEFSKRMLLDSGFQQHLSYMSAGLMGDFAGSIIYVPSEVLKTRLQLQGQHNNPFFTSGFNYRGTLDAARTIIRREGFGALFHGYTATVARDLPFSALQFTFWEQFQSWARYQRGDRDIGIGYEMLTGATAGGLAGIITCPLDVVKTRLQTQQSDPAVFRGTTTAAMATASPSSSSSAHVTPNNAAQSQFAPPSSSSSCHAPPPPSPQTRSISTSSPSTHVPRRGARSLGTTSVIEGLRVIYREEGLSGWFRGVGPRGVWTFIQSGCMLFLYQRLLRQLEKWDPPPDNGVL